MARIMKILDTGATIADPAVPQHLTPNTQHLSLEFRDVWFRYPKAKDDNAKDRGWALEGISFTAPAGSWVAVVGATGAGKSTLVELIPRLSDPDKGSVLVGGVPVRDLPLAELRARIGFVPQDTFLFSQTIGENIGLGAASQDAIVEAARIAQLDETVAELPQGYDTMLGERGINLSGGQKQRTAIARALARDPGIIVLDDALSAVDTETEAAILRNLKQALKGRTAVVVSHRSPRCVTPTSSWCSTRAASWRRGSTASCSSGGGATGAAAAPAVGGESYRRDLRKPGVSAWSHALRRVIMPSIIMIPTMTSSTPAIRSTHTMYFRNF